MVMAAGFSGTRTDMGWRARIRQHTRATFPSSARLLVWTPVAVGAGAAAYFALGAEPSETLRVWLWLAAACLLALAVAARHRSVLLCAGILSAFALIGFASAQGRALSAAPAMAVEPWERARTVEGWIERVERSGSRERVLVRVSALQGADVPPRRVRVVVDRGELRPGDGVRRRAAPPPPRGPRAPGGYDAERASWFQGIALTGFAIAAPETSPVDGDRLERGFLQWRWDLAERLRASAGERTGGIIAALLTGDRSGIENDDAEALRMSGLGHILAI
jgi:competence protein ComEC